MTINPNLFKAILSMDSYNRGYNAAINLTGNAVGNAQILTTTLDGSVVNLDSAVIRNPSTGERLDDDIGFYALAYDWNGETVISYRGTDYPLKNGNTSLGVSKDVFHGWIGGGFAANDNGLEFRKAA